VFISIKRSIVEAPSPAPTNGQLPVYSASQNAWVPTTFAPGGGTVISVGLSPAAGFTAGAPVTLSGLIPFGVSVTGLLKGVSGGLAEAVAGTDYVSPSSQYNDPDWLAELSGTKLVGAVSATELQGVALSVATPVDGQVLAYSRAASQWEPQTLTIQTVAAPLTINACAALIIRVTAVSLTSNVATYTTAVAHGYAVGQLVTVYNLTHQSFNGAYPITSVPTATTFTVALTGSNLSTTSDNGTAMVLPLPAESITDQAGNALVVTAGSGSTTRYGTNLSCLALQVPAGLVVTPQGATGTTQYGYRVSAMNAQGETLASAEATTNTGPAVLTSGNGISLSWSPVFGASWYGVYGRTIGAEQFQARIAAPTTSWIDSGAINPAGPLPANPAGSTLTTQAWQGQQANQYQALDSSGNVLSAIDAQGLGFPRTLTWVLGSGQPVTTGTDLTNHLTVEHIGKPLRVYLAAKTAPTGQALIVDILRSSDGGTTWTSFWATNPGNRPQLAVGTKTSSQINFDTTAVSAGDLLRIDVIQVGSTVAGQDLTVQFLLSTRNQG